MIVQAETGETGQAEVIELSVISVDRSVPGLLRIRVAAPGSEDGTVDLSGLAVSVAGDEVDATVTPVEVDSMQVVLVLDVSGSMRGEALASAKASVSDFVASLPERAEVAVVSFGPQAQIVQPATPDRDAVLQAVESLEAGGETALYDGLLTAIEIPASAHRLPIVVLSDGGDTASTTTLAELEAVLDQVPHTVYPIALATDESNQEVLATLASASGGHLATTDRADGLLALYEQLSATLASEYEVVVEVDREGPATVALTLGPDGVAGSGAVSGADTYQWTGVVDLPDIVERSTATNRSTSEPEPFIMPEPGYAAAPELMLVGAGLIGAAVLFAIVAWLMGESGRGAAKRSFRPAEAPQPAALDDFRRDTAIMVEGVMRGNATIRLANQLDAAGIKMRVGELIMLSAVAAVGLAILGFMIIGLLGLVLAVPGFTLPRVYLRLRQRKRAKAFDFQLPDILVALANVLRVGYSMNRGLASVAREIEEPAKSELNRAIMEARVGGDLVSALRGVADRTTSGDLVWVVDAIEINMAVGGDMVAVLENVAETVRSRVTLHAQIAALTAEGRMSAFVLMLLPPGLTAFIAISNPAYFEGVFANVLAFWMAGGAVTMLSVGGLWIRKMINAVG